MVRLLVSTNVIPPYRVAFFECLYDVGQRYGVEVDILAWGGALEGRRWPTVHECGSAPLHILSRELTRHGRAHVTDLPRLARLVAQLNPDVILSTGFGLESMLAILVARRRRVKALLWSETIEGMPRDGGRGRSRLRDALTGASAGLCVPGQRAEEYVRARWPAVPTLRLKNSVDPRIFQLRSPRQSRRSYVLTVGRLDRDKGIHRLAPFVERVLADGTFNRWIVVGSGALATDVVRDLRGRLGAQLDWRPDEGASGIAALLRHASAFLLVPDIERWGFAIHEAAAVGVPTVTSIEVGCVPDLLLPAGAPLLLAPGAFRESSSSIDDALRLAAGAPAENAARVIAENIQANWSPDVAAEEFVRSLIGLDDGLLR